MGNDVAEILRDEFEASARSLPTDQGDEFKQAHLASGADCAAHAAGGKILQRSRGEVILSRHRFRQ